MTFLIPDLAAAGCLRLTLRATVRTRDESLHAWCRQHADGATATAATAGGPVSARVRLEAADAACRVHIDLAQDNSVGDRPPTGGGIDAVLAPFAGRAADAFVSAVLQRPLGETPALVRSLAGAANVSADEVSVRLSAVAFAVRGAPVRTVSWAIDEPGRRLRTGLDADISIAFTESVLTDAVTQVRRFDEGMTHLGGGNG